jgi:hypothetical protein
MSSVGSGKNAPRNIKKGCELDQRRRVRDAIERQRSARKERVDLARRLGQGADYTSPEMEVRASSQSLSKDLIPTS